jgi:L-aminopeptidase/D-esterase-like protein
MSDTDDLTTVAWCGQALDGMAQHLRMWGQQQDGDLALVLKSEAADRIEELERWKREATEVIANWDLVAEMVTPRTQDLGRSKADLVADEVTRLRGQLQVHDLEVPR